LCVFVRRTDPEFINLSICGQRVTFNSRAGASAVLALTVSGLPTDAFRRVFWPIVRPHGAAADLKLKDLQATVVYI
jgi:hypothetical protein